MIYASAEEICRRAESFLAQLGALPEVTVELIEGQSLIGGGTAPNATLPTLLIAVSSDRYGAEELQARLRAQAPPVIARIEDDRLMLDLRTVFEEEEGVLLKAMHEAMVGKAPG
jgi:L-seryl-tRNA(Ser) seleniumtransferase